MKNLEFQRGNYLLPKNAQQRLLWIKGEKKMLARKGNR